MTESKKKTTPKAAPKAAPKPTTVKMVNPEGKEADVHPSEVENYKAGDYQEV